MIQVLALQIHLCPTQFPGQTFGIIKRARPTHVLGQIIGLFTNEIRVILCRLESGRDFVDQWHQGFGHKLASINAEVSPFVGTFAVRIQLGHHQFSQVARGH